MHIRNHTRTSTHVQSAHARWRQPGNESQVERGGRRALLETLHTQKKKCQENLLFMDVKNRFVHMELPAKLLDYFLRSNKSNINQSCCLIKTPYL